MHVCVMLCAACAMITLYPRTFLRSAWPMVSDLLPLTLTLPGRVLPLSEPLMETPRHNIISLVLMTASSPPMTLTMRPHAPSYLGQHMP